MFKYIFAFIILGTLMIFGVSLPFPLEKNIRQLTLEWKTYHLPDDEPITLYGAKRRRFLTESLYWGEAGYGALSGQRSGYLEGGVIVGSQNLITKRILSDARVFFGAGGGGSAPQGSGMILNPTIGLGFQLNRQIRVFSEIGYIKFLNGDIESSTFGVTVNWNYWELSKK